MVMATVTGKNNQNKMKKLILSIVLATTCFVGYSQTTNITKSSFWGDLWTGIKESDIAQATNWGVDGYATYAPEVAKKSDRFGGGVLVLYNFNRFASTGLGFDYLGQFSLVSANLELKLPIQAFKNVSFLPQWIRDSYQIPFVLGGVGKPLGGTSSDVAVIADVGYAMTFGHLWGGQFNTGFTYGSWINAGDYSGKRYHVFLGWSAKF